MESLPTSKIRFCDSNRLSVKGPREWSTSLIEVLIPTDQWDSVSLSLNGKVLAVRLAKLAGKTAVLADWPLADPGYYELHLGWGDGSEKRMVSVQPEKISAAAFGQLLTDLETTLPSAVAMTLQQMGALAGVKILPPDESTLAMEVTRLRHAISGTDSRIGLAAVLLDLASRPHQILRSEEVWVKAEQARRPHPARLKDAACRGYNYAPAGQLRTVLDTRVKHTFDVYENRLLRVFAFQVHQRLRVLHRILIRKNPDSALVGELQELGNCLKRARRQASFLNEVGLPRHLSTQTTMVLLNRPSYRAAMQGFLAFHKNAAMRMDEPRLDAPLENLPFLYQRWGTLEVIQTLLEVAAEQGYEVKQQQLVRRELGGLCLQILPDGKPAIELMHPETGTTVKLIPERSYRKSGTLRSISFSQRPDIAIEVESPTCGMAVYLFDPKYKLKSDMSLVAELDPEKGTPDEAIYPGSPKKVDIDKMHSYRDAIRDSHLDRVVRYAAILYPGPEVRYGDDIEALHAYPGDTEGLKARLRHVLSIAISQ